jgi:hypothetical protein
MKYRCEIQMCLVPPRKELIGQTKMAMREVAQKAYNLGFSQEDWMSCPLWKETIAAADQLISNH